MPSISPVRDLSSTTSDLDHTTSATDPGDANRFAGMMSDDRSNPSQPLGLAPSPRGGGSAKEIPIANPPRAMVRPPPRAQLPAALPASPDSLARLAPGLRPPPAAAIRGDLDRRAARLLTQPQESDDEVEEIVSPEVMKDRQRAAAPTTMDPSIPLRSVTKVYTGRPDRFTNAQSGEDPAEQELLASLRLLDEMSAIGEEQRKSAKR
jgi:hypothetical protein